MRYDKPTAVTRMKLVPVICNKNTSVEQVHEHMQRRAKLKSEIACVHKIVKADWQYIKACRKNIRAPHVDELN